MKCSKCGKEINDNSQYCKFCGNQINNNMSSKKIFVLKRIHILLIIMLVIVGIIIYPIVKKTINTNNNLQSISKTDTRNIKKDEQNTSTSNGTREKDNVSTSITGIEQAVKDGMIGEDYLTDGVTEDKLNFAFSDGNLQMYYDNWEDCIADARKLNIIKVYETFYEFPSSIKTFPIETGDTVQTINRKSFRNAPSYDAEIVQTTNIITTALEVNGDWVNTTIGWIPVYDLEGEKPVELNIHIPITEQNHYVEIKENYYITNYIICKLSQKKGTLANALKSLNNILDFELKQENGKTYLNSIRGVPNLKGLTNNEEYKWVVSTNKDRFDDRIENLDEVDIERTGTIFIEYVSVDKLK